MYDLIQQCLTKQVPEAVGELLPMTDESAVFSCGVLEFSGCQLSLI
jgi:hypothetical protein